MSKLMKFPIDKSGILLEPKIFKFYYSNHRGVTISTLWIASESLFISYKNHKMSKSCSNKKKVKTSILDRVRIETLNETSICRKMNIPKWKKRWNSKWNAISFFEIDQTKHCKINAKKLTLSFSFAYFPQWALPSAIFPALRPSCWPWQCSTFSARFNNAGIFSMLNLSPWIRLFCS